LSCRRRAPQSTTRTISCQPPEQVPSTTTTPTIITTHVFGCWHAEGRLERGRIAPYSRRLCRGSSALNNISTRPTLTALEWCVDTHASGLYVGNVGGVDTIRRGGCAIRAVISATRPTLASNVINGANGNSSVSATATRYSCYSTTPTCTNTNSVSLSA
jgi:hypothetical protein